MTHMFHNRAQEVNNSGMKRYLINRIARKSAGKETTGRHFFLLCIPSYTYGTMHVYTSPNHIANETVINVFKVNQMPSFKHIFSAMTYQGRVKIAAISQMTFSNAVAYMKVH